MWFLVVQWFIHVSEREILQGKEIIPVQLHHEVDHHANLDCLVSVWSLNP